MGGRGHTAITGAVVAGTPPSAVLSDQSDPVEVLLDTAIFADGFESGDTSAWSSTVP